MKKKIIILLLMIFSITFISCKDKKENSIDDNNIINNENNDDINNDNNNGQNDDNHNDDNNQKDDNNDDQKDDNNNDNNDQNDDHKDDNKDDHNDDNNDDNKDDNKDDDNKDDNNDDNKNDELKKYSLQEIIELGNKLSNNEKGIKVSFEAMYVKAITDNNDKLMLFVDDNSYLNVRVVGGFDAHLKNRYTNCYYYVEGTVCKNNNDIEVEYLNLSNITSTKEDFNYSNITKNCNTIGDVYSEIEKVNLNKKYNGVGKIVTFKGICIATDRSDANKKAVLYDNTNCITIISEKKVCDGVSDINKEFTITGIISILKSEPAILVLDYKKESTNSITIDYTNTIEVLPSYFSKWYHVSDKIKDPNYSDFGKVYKIKGYINTDESRTTAFYFGLTDNENDKLSDTGIKTSIKGVYLMNYQNIKENDKEPYGVYDNYYDGTYIEAYIVLYQFDTQNHAWKVFLIDSTMKEVDE